MDRLIERLRSEDEVEREAAVARLRVSGSRAIARLDAVVASASAPAVRAAALRALDGIDDPHAVAPALPALDDPSTLVAVAAIGVLRGWLLRETGTRVLDALTAVALDPTRDVEVRRAAVEALRELPPEIVRPILDEAGTDAPRTTPALDDPAAARAWLAAHAERAPLSQLHDLVVDARTREGAERAAPRRAEWTSVRGAAHAALARRGSRVALYDLREALERPAEGWPLDFLTAVATVGDATCLEPMARAWTASGEPWLRERLAQSAEAIVHRTRLSGRSAVMKRIRARYPGFV